jgi:hypothetical protein
MKALMVFVMVMLTGLESFSQHQLAGAWEFKEAGLVHTMIVADQYFSVASYSKQEKKFSGTYGGTLQYANGNISGAIEFNSNNKENVGTPYTFPVTIRGNEMLLTRDGKKELWKRIDGGMAPLAGNWRISGRDQNGQMVPINPGPRKTIKILSATRFQWAAINTGTGEFFGTGGGTYSLSDGKYAESIEFFSRDSSRVGMLLSFDAKVEGKEWLHSGKSSKGDPVKEIWRR